jgi:tetraprenyl-beta-curcumene synthase
MPGPAVYRRRGGPRSDQRGAAALREAPSPLAMSTHVEGSRSAELMQGLTFCSTVARYLVSVLPRVTHELEYWRTRALGIPDPALRANALEGLSKRGNMEGAALFAVLAPRAQRRETVRALVSFQAAYNYLDVLAEQPGPDAVSRARQLHTALLVALDPDASHTDYYASYPYRDDNGYLTELVDTCRDAFASLPSRRATIAAVMAAVERIIAFQSLNLTESQGGHEALELWARDNTPDASGLQWWQVAAAGGSSLAVHALIALAANPGICTPEIAAVEAAYFPWVCALHSLMDSLADLAEDEQAGQRNLLSYHATIDETAAEMQLLARHAVNAICTVPRSRGHRVILTAMVTYYTSSPTASTPDARAVAGIVMESLAPFAAPALALFKARRLLARAQHGAYR